MTVLYLNSWSDSLPNDIEIVSGRADSRKILAKARKMGIEVITVKDYRGRWPKTLKALKGEDLQKIEEMLKNENASRRKEPSLFARVRRYYPFDRVSANELKKIFSEEEMEFIFYALKMSMLKRGIYWQWKEGFTNLGIEEVLYKAFRAHYRHAKTDYDYKEQVKDREFRSEVKNLYSEEGEEFIGKIMEKLTKMLN